MDKIIEIRDLLREIHDLDLISNKEQWNYIADNVIKELRSLRDSQSASNSTRKYRPPPSPLSPPNSSACSIHSSDSLPASPSTSSASHSHSDAVSSGDTNSIYDSAADAFDRQIYSRCVQIVENAQRQEPISMSLITLAHHSYNSLVEESASTTDAAKFAVWWCKFLDDTNIDEFSNTERLDLFEFQLVAYEKFLYLKDDEMDTKRKVLNKLEQMENMAKLLYRAFDSKYLRILEKMHCWLEEFSSDLADDETYKLLKSTIEKGLERAQSDRESIERNESKPLSFDDPEYALCCSLLTQLAHSYENMPIRWRKNNSDSGVTSKTSSTASLDKILIMRL